MLSMTTKLAKQHVLVANVFFFCFFFCKMTILFDSRQASQQSVEDGERRLQIIETEREALKLQVTKLKAVAEEKRQVRNPNNFQTTIFETCWKKRGVKMHKSTSLVRKPQTFCRYGTLSGCSRVKFKTI